MSKREPKLLIEDILESAFKILEYTKNMTFDQFIQDHRTIDAVIRNFEIIGEAANRLPEDFKNANPSIDWQQIRGFKNRIVHDYSIVWQIKQSFLPHLIEKLKQITFF